MAQLNIINLNSSSMNIFNKLLKEIILVWEVGRREPLWSRQWRQSFKACPLLIGQWRQSFLTPPILHSPVRCPSSRLSRCRFCASRVSISRFQSSLRSSHWLTSSSRQTVWSTRRFLHLAAASLFRWRRIKRRFSSSVGSAPRFSWRRPL